MQNNARMVSFQIQINVLCVVSQYKVWHSLSNPCLGSETKDGERCIDRCGCEYPEGWSSGSKKCLKGWCIKKYLDNKT